MQIEVGLGDYIAFHASGVSQFEILAVVTKLLDDGSFLCFSTTPPFSNLGEFAILEGIGNDFGVEVICRGEDAVKSQSFGQLELEQRVQTLGLDDDIEFVEGRVVAALDGQIIVEDDNGRRIHSIAELCVPID
jgi:hypothetical protein